MAMAVRALNRAGLGRGRRLEQVGKWRFRPETLFATGAPGLAYDLNDYSTLFQDSAGTTPVTAAGQPVGLVLDKSKGRALGAELVSNGSFATDIAGWTAQYSALVSWESGALKLTGTTTGTQRASTPITCVVGRAYKVSAVIRRGTTAGNVLFLAANNAALNASIASSVSVSSTSPTAVSFVFTATATTMYVGINDSSSSVGATSFADDVSVKELPGNHAFQATAASRPILRQSPVLGPELVTNGTFDTDTAWTKGAGVSISGGVATLVVGSGYLEQGFSTVAGRVYQVTATASGSQTYCGAWDTAGQSSALSSTPASRSGVFTFTFTANDATSFVGFAATASGAVSIDNVSVREITGYYTDRNYLEFDGVDDFLATGNIDFSVTDKVSVFAGVRKLSDAAAGWVVEFSASSAGGSGNNGVFGVQAPGSGATDRFVFNSRGNAGVTPYAVATNAAYVAPKSAVLTGYARISTDVCVLRVDGVQAAVAGGDQATGNYGNYPLYIGRRGGTTLPFKGYLYSLIIVGKLASDSEVQAAEKYIAQRTGVTLQ